MFKAVWSSRPIPMFYFFPGKSPIPPVDEAALTVSHLLNNGRQERQEVVSVTWLLQFNLCSSITAWRKKNAFMVHFQNGRHSPYVVLFFSVTMKYITFFSWAKVFHSYIKSSCADVTQCSWCQTKVAPLTGSLSLCWHVNVYLCDGTHICSTLMWFSWTPSRASLWALVVDFLAHGEAITHWACWSKSEKWKKILHSCAKAVKALWFMNKGMRLGGRLTINDVRFEK